jgi:biotin carboxyl carrier protein
MKMNVKVDGHSFAVEVGDLSRRPIEVTVEGEVFEVYPQEAQENETRALPRPPAGLPLPATPRVASTAAGAKVVVAPIPGVIVMLNVKAGDTIAFGQELCVLEAMKMKNIIRANRAGTIAAARVAVGDQVKHGQTLMEFTD